MQLKREFSVRRYTFETNRLDGLCDCSIQVLLDVDTIYTDINNETERTSFGEVLIQYTVYNGAHFTHNFQILNTTAGALDLHDRNIVTKLLREVIAGQKNQVVYN